MGLGKPLCAGCSELFFSLDADDIEVAKAVCTGCSRRASCLAGAVERKEMCGVWGGQLFRDGTVLSVTPRRGRPRSSVA